MTLTTAVTRLANILEAARIVLHASKLKRGSVSEMS